MENKKQNNIAFDGQNVSLEIPRHDYKVVLFK